MQLAPPPARRARRLTTSFFVVGLGLLAASLSSGAPAGAVQSGATSSLLTVTVSGHGPAFLATIHVSCESPPARQPRGNVEIGSAATASRFPIPVPADGNVSFPINDLADGSACAITAAGRTASGLTAADGGTQLVGSDGQLRGVAVTVDRGTPVTAHLTFTIPAVTNAAVPQTEATTATDAAGSGSAALAPPALPGSDGAASAAAPVALAAARSTTTASSAALPDPSGTGTALVIASVGVLLCGAVAYALVLTSRREPHVH